MKTNVSVLSRAEMKNVMGGKQACCRISVNGGGYKDYNCTGSAAQCQDNADDLCAADDLCDDVDCN